MRHKLLTLLVVLLVVLSACRTAQPVPADQSTPGPVPDGGQVNDTPAASSATIKGRLLYVQAGQAWLWSGTGARKVNLGTDVVSPVWSHDGKRVAFVRKGESYADVYVGQIDSGTPIRITFNASKATPRTFEYVHQSLWAVQPSWSPDDSEIVFAGQAAPATTEQSANPIYEAPFSLYRYPLKFVGKREPTNQDELPIKTDSDLQSPRWSPDGHWLAYVDTPRTPDLRRIMRFSFAGNTAEPFPGIPAGAYDPAWSPDGSTLAFAATENGATDIWIVPATGGIVQRVTNLGRERAPVWSPDGKQLASINVGDTYSDIYVTDLSKNGSQITTGETHQVTQKGQVDANSPLSWSQ